MLSDYRGNSNPNPGAQTSNKPILLAFDQNSTPIFDTMEVTGDFILTSLNGVLIANDVNPVTAIVPGADGDLLMGISGEFNIGSIVSSDGSINVDLSTPGEIDLIVVGGGGSVTNPMDANLETGGFSILYTDVGISTTTLNLSTGAMLNDDDIAGNLSAYISANRGQSAALGAYANVTLELDTSLTLDVSSDSDANFSQVVSDLTNNREINIQGGTDGGAGDSYYQIDLDSDNIFLLQLDKTYLKFPAAPTLSADQNTLDNYKEDYSTPTLDSSAGGSAPAYTSQYLSYTIIGDRCFFTIYLQVSGVAGMAGNLSIGGLPVPSNAEADNNTVITFNGGTFQAGTTGDLSGIINSNSSSINLFRYTGGNLTPLIETDLQVNSIFRLQGSYKI